MNPKPVIKPTRRELLDIAIGEYCKNLRELQLTTKRQSYALESEMRELEKQKDARLLAHIRAPHNERIEALEKAVQPFDGRIYVGINHLGVSGISHFMYTASVEFREELKAGSGPDMSDLDALIAEKRALSRQYSNDADDIGRRVSKVDNLDLFKHIVGSLPPEAGELLDQLAVMIGNALGDKEELVVVVYDIVKDGNTAVIERCPCHSRIQAESLQKKLSQQYEEGYSVEIEKP